MRDIKFFEITFSKSGRDNTHPVLLPARSEFNFKVRFKGKQYHQCNNMCAHKSVLSQ